MLQYDNLEDVRSKLLGTYIYYDGKVHLVKDAMEVEMGKYALKLATPNARNYKTAFLNDEGLNFMRYNLGYSNHGHSAAWWYRIPLKQYRQGLKAEQVRPFASKEEFLHRVEFGMNKPIIDMLENVYPKFEEIEKPLKDRNAEVLAFHKDFAACWDHIHKDMILEYKGKAIGCFKKDFELMDEYQHLIEALKEAVA
jgi:hypothetical protein